MKLRDWIELFRIQLHREDGQTIAESGVVLAVIIVGVVAAIGLSLSRSPESSASSTASPALD
jgi:hypothetical protein